MKKAKWGIIGTGQISSSFVRDFEHVYNGEIISIYGRNAKKLTSFSLAYGINHTYTDLDEMLSDESLDVVYIGTTNDSHYDLAMMAIQHKKAVLLEKPFALNHKQTSQLINEAKKNGVFIMEALWTLFLPALKQSFKWIEDNEIGKVIHITANFSFKGDNDEESRLNSKILGGGSLLDVGIYPLLMFQYLAKSPIADVYASGRLTPSGVDEFASFQLTYENGVTASGFSGINMDSNHDCVIYGEKGYIHIPSFWMSNHTYLYKNGAIETYRDDEACAGYCYEAIEVSKNILSHQTENSTIPHEFTLTLSNTLDRIRKIIGVHYPVD